MPLSDISAHRQLHPLEESAVQSKVGRISSTNTRGFLTWRKLTLSGDTRQNVMLPTPPVLRRLFLFSIAEVFQPS
jgi:hypothetical protein